MAAVCYVPDPDIMFLLRKYLIIKYEGDHATFSNSLKKNVAVSVPLKCDPVKLIELHSIRNENIVCAAAASNGSWICYSTVTVTRLYQTIEVQSVPKLEKVSMPLEDDVAVNVTFSSDSSQLVLLTRQGRLIVLALTLEDSPDVTISYEYRPYENGYLTDAAHILAMSKCKSYIVVADHDSNIAVWNGKKYYCSLPKAKSQPTALAIHPETNNVVVAYSNQQLVEYSLATRSFTEFSRKLVLPESWTSSSFVATNVTFDPRNPDVIVFHSDVSICVVNRTETVENPSPKIPRKQQPSQKFVFNMIKKYKHLVLFDWICDDEVAAVEVSPSSFISQLPPPLKMKKFGVM